MEVSFRTAYALRRHKRPKILFNTNRLKKMPSRAVLTVAEEIKSLEGEDKKTMKHNHANSATNNTTNNGGCKVAAEIQGVRVRNVKGGVMPRIMCNSNHENT